MQMTDQQDQLQRRRAIQDLALKHVTPGPDGKPIFDQQGYAAELATLDPQAAMELHQNELRAKLTELQTQKAMRPDTEQVYDGDKVLTQEVGLDGQRKTIASAPRWQRQAQGGGQETAIERNLGFLMKQGYSREQALQALGLPLPGAAPDAQGYAPGTPNGEDFLKTLPTDRQGIVRAVVEGRYPVPTGKSATSQWWQAVVQDAQQVDPTFEAGSYQARAASRKDFTSGTTAKNITALNTAAHHLDQLLEQGKKLNNGRFPMLNSIANSAGQAVGKDAVNNYNLNADAVADELAKVFAGSNGALADREQIRSRLDANLSPEQQEGFGRTAASLIEGRLAGLQAQLD